MRRVRKAVYWMAVGLIGTSTWVSAEPPLAPVKPATEHTAVRTVNVKVEKVVAIALGAGASAHTDLAHDTAQSAGDRTNTVQVHTLYHMAIGPQASVCIHIPLLEDARICDPHDSGETGLEK